jgi:guanylate cyclase
VAVKERLAHWLAWLALAGTRPGDTGDERLSKTVLTYSALLITVLATFWTLSYLALGLRQAALIPFAYQALSVIGFVQFVRTGDFPRFRFGQLALMLILPFALQWKVGGFVNSGGVILWAFTSPLGALLFQGWQHAGSWFAAFLALAAGAGLLDRFASEAAPAMPSWVILLYFVMNIGGVTGVAFVLMRYFARERQQTLEALNRQHHLLQEEQARSEGLLLNILPRPIAERLKRDQAVIADGFAEATVLFADIVDFTRMSAFLTPGALVAFLNDLFSTFDRLSDRFGLEKIKTVGDAYMAVAGLPAPRPDHAQAAAEMALEIQEELTRRTAPGGGPLLMRIGLHSGPVVAGVIGTKKFIYDLWGDTVNTASRMESHGLAGAIQVTEAAYERLRASYSFEERGVIQVKGKGPMRTFILTGRRPQPAPDGAATSAERVPSLSWPAEDVV